VKYSRIAEVAVLWLVRRSDQPGDFMQSVKYVTISLLLVAVTTI